jgi:hypothetical protein
MSSQLSDSEWIKKFNEFSKVEFIRRYQEYFQTNESPELRPIFTVETKWITEEGKIELKSMSLQEQYDVILKKVKDKMFNSPKKIFHKYDNMVKGFSVWRPMKIEESETEDNVMHFTLLLEDTGPNYSRDKKWIESEYPKFYDKILKKSMSLSAGDYFGIYYDNKKEEIGFTVFHYQE